MMIIPIETILYYFNTSLSLCCAFHSVLPSSIGDLHYLHLRTTSRRNLKANPHSLKLPLSVVIRLENAKAEAENFQPALAKQTTEQGKLCT